MEDDEAHCPPALEFFQQVDELARKAVQNVASENEEQLQKEDEVVEEKIVQDEAVTQMEDDEIPQEAHVVAAITEEDSQKIDTVGDASLQKEVENIAEKEHQKVDTPQNVEENPSVQDQRVEENTEQVAQEVDKDTLEVVEILASKMMSGENAQSQEDEKMKFSTGFDLNIEDLNSNFNTDVFQDAQETIHIVQETFETEDQNVQVSADQHVQENPHDVKATQSKKLKASKFIPMFSSKVEIIDFETIGQQNLLLKEDSITLED